MIYKSYAGLPDRGYPCYQQCYYYILPFRIARAGLVAESSVSGLLDIWNYEKPNVWSLSAKIESMSVLGCWKHMCTGAKSIGDFLVLSYWKPYKARQKPWDFEDPWKCWENQHLFKISEKWLYKSFPFEPQNHSPQNPFQVDYHVLLWKPWNQPAKHPARRWPRWNEGLPCGVGGTRFKRQLWLRTLFHLRKPWFWSGKMSR